MSQRQAHRSRGPEPDPHRNRRFLVGLARAFGGAIVFSLPMLMTMELWQLGFYIDPLRLLLLLAATLPLLAGLSHFIGFEDTRLWVDDIVDAFVAYAVGFVAALPVLALFGVIASGMSSGEIVGKLALQAVPGSIGALLAQSQFGGESAQKEQRRETYGSETFFMTVGALFLSLNIAPTEEIVLISYQMAIWQALALASVSLVLMHAFVYSFEFRGGSERPTGVTGISLFLRYTVVGYAICIAMSTYILWTFGRLTGMSGSELAMAVVVLAFPAAIGAAAARLIL